MKFKAEPNLYVRIANKYVQRVTGKKGFYFDDKGEYTTENEVLIKVISQNFEIVEEVAEVVKEVEEIVEGKAETKQRHCKKCDFTCETQGEILKHYKTEHPKGD